VKQLETSYNLTFFTPPKDLYKFLNDKAVIQPLNIGVFGLNSQITSSRLYNIFSCYGNVKTAKIFNDKKVRYYFTFSDNIYLRKL